MLVCKSICSFTEIGSAGNWIFLKRIELEYNKKLARSSGTIIV